MKLNRNYLFLYHFSMTTNVKHIFSGVHHFSDGLTSIQNDEFIADDLLNRDGLFKGLPLPLQRGTYTSSFPYVNCNEEGQDLIFKQLQESKIAPERRLLIGFSVWFNYDLIAQTQPAAAIIADIDNSVLDIFKAVSDCLAKSPSRVDFVNNFKQYLELNCKTLFNLTSSNDVHSLFDISRELTRENSWLSKEQYFQKVKKLHADEKVLYLNLDITDRTKFRTISSWIQTNDYEVDTLYASNIVEWLQNPLKEQSYLLNLQMIASENTRFIQAAKPFQTGSPVQKLEIGRDNIDLPEKPARKNNKKRVNIDSISDLLEF